MSTEAVTAGGAKVLDGKKVAAELAETTRGYVQRIEAESGVKPCLVTVLVGDNPASITYTKMKRKRCEAVGMASRKVELPNDTTTQQLVDCIGELGGDASVHGILLQHPSPPQVDERAAFEAIPKVKDVDGVTLSSFAAMAFGLPGWHSATPGGMVRLLDAYDLDVTGMHAVVIGRSAILGKPMAALLLERNATVTVCHSRTRDIADLVRTADVVVAAVGRPEFVKGDWVNPGAIVLDAGYNEGNVGDADYEGCAARASWITPVPGGVGPMTIATLIEQTALAAGEQLGVTLDA
ncbi:MAG: bifunctional 5,10-methylenetetrahydrofolate dehydrogenase/5,10-methenyltetrahydrofolate cyclohydrolase [Planctomycetota bacterium]